MTSSILAELPVNPISLPTVSVIVPVYNGERDLPELTRRLLA
ncbi:MAG: glycosyltransferase, partial [Cyanobacteria bacterium Co-bin13]|nr:glycosyltransferase [Cyanobacteria bacterium Co-bin13]